MVRREYAYVEQKAAGHHSSTAISSLTRSAPPSFFLKGKIKQFGTEEAVTVQESLSERFSMELFSYEW